MAGGQYLDSSAQGWFDGNDLKLGCFSNCVVIQKRMLIMTLGLLKGAHSTVNLTCRELL